MVDYLDLVEEHRGESEINLFEKVKVMTSRARDLYSGKTSKAATKLEGCKPVTVAQYEVLKGYIEPEISDIEKDMDSFPDE